MKARARAIGWGIFGLLVLGAAWPGHDAGRLFAHGHEDVCPLAVEGGPEACCLSARHAAPPVVQLKVRVPAYSAPGKEIIYRICVENTSSAEAHHVMVRNPVPANAKFVKADPPPTVKDAELIWKLGTIGGGACREIELVLAPTDREDVKNCTRVLFEHGQCVTTRQAAYTPPGGVPFPGGAPFMPPAITTDPPPDGGDPKVKQPVPHDGEAKLSVVINGPAKQYANLTANYFITVTNNGTAPATNLLLNAFLPDKGKFVKASDDGRFLENQVAWVLGTLKPGASRTVELEVKALAAGELCVRATALADRGVKSNTAELCTLFGGVSAVHPDLFDTKDPIALGEETSYIIIVENQGSLPITNVQVQGLLSPLLSYTQIRSSVSHKFGDVTAKGQAIVFDTIPSVEIGSKVTLEVFVKGLKPGDGRFRVLIVADQLKDGGPVHQEESTLIFREDEAPKGRLLSRRIQREE